jgi:hypothetical protein
MNEGIPQDLPNTIEWRGTHWRLGLGDCYYPDKTETHVGLRLRSDCSVWRSEVDGTWMASLIPSPECKARSATRATPGATPQEALDGEAVVWLMTALMLPGARELLTEVCGFAFSEAPPAAAESPQTSE